MMIHARVSSTRELTDAYGLRADRKVYKALVEDLLYSLVEPLVTLLSIELSFHPDIRLRPAQAIS